MAVGALEDSCAGAAAPGAGRDSSCGSRDDHITIETTRSAMTATEPAISAATLRIGFAAATAMHFSMCFSRASAAGRLANVSLKPHDATKLENMSIRLKSHRGASQPLPEPLHAYPEYS